MSEHQKDPTLCLTDDEFQSAFQEAKNRSSAHATMSLADHFNPGDKRFAYDFGNAAGYVLLARLADVEWVSSHGPRRPSPVSPWRPHWSGDPDGPLLVRPDAADDELHVLVTGSVPGRLFTLRGYMIGEDAKQYPLDKSLREPAHVVPQDALSAMPPTRPLHTNDRATLRRRGARLDLRRGGR